MPTTVFQTINVHSRNHIIRNRDTIQNDFNIEIFFPRNKVRGEFQDMALKGGTKAIFDAQKLIRSILVDWKEEYDAFKERKKTRKYNQFKPSEDIGFAWPSISNMDMEKKHTSSNPFEVLALDEPSVMDLVPVVKSTKKTLTGWSKVAAPSTYSDTRPWADMSDDEN